MDPATLATIGTSLMGSEVAASAVPAFLAPAINGALIGAGGSLLTGSNPLTGALLGGATGGIGSQLGLGSLPGIGSLFGGGSGGAGSAVNNLINSGTGDNGLFSGLVPEAAQVASSAGSKISNFLPYAGIGLAAAGADRFMSPKIKSPEPHEVEDFGEVKPTERQYNAVDPSLYYGVGGNRKFFNTVNPGVSYLKSGGRAMSKAAGIGMIKGAGNGTSDSVPAMLSDGEYVFPAAAVSALGNGSNDAGAKKLDTMKKKVIKKHYGGRMKPAMGLGSYIPAGA